MKNRAIADAKYRAKNILKRREQARQYNLKVRGTAEYRERQRKWNEEHYLGTEKYKANFAVNNAVAQGKLIKPSVCECCGESGRIHGHHADYSKPLQVNWLCKKCHAAIHHPLPLPPSTP